MLQMYFIFFTSSWVDEFSVEDEYSYTYKKIPKMRITGNLLFRNPKQTKKYIISCIHETQ